MSNYTIHTPAPRVGRYQYTKATYVEPCPGAADEDAAYQDTCPRCGGSGRMPYMVDAGRCWGPCGGNPNYSRTVTVGQVRHAEQLRVKRANASLRAEAKAQHAWDHFLAEAEAAGYGQWARAHEIDSEFISSMVTRVRAGKQLSDKQVTAGAEALHHQLTRSQRQAEAEAAKAELPALEEGRRVLTGAVASTKLHESQYGNSFKMVLQLDGGHRVWGTIPNSLMEEHRVPPVGTRVQLTATVTRSDDDHTFGFFKRPAKATRLAE